MDELCSTTGWHRNHARKMLTSALDPELIQPQSPRPPKYGPKVVAALVLCWLVLDMPTGKRLAPVLSELVNILRSFGELDIDDDTAALLAGMSAATIDRRLAPERKVREANGLSRVRPAFLWSKRQIKVRNRKDWDDTVPGFTEIDLFAHDGGNASGEHAWTLTLTDIATGWGESRSVANLDRDCVLGALEEIAAAIPFSMRGVYSARDSEVIGRHLLAWCEQRQITFIGSWSGSSDDVGRTAQEHSASVRVAVGYHRYDTTAELLLLNKIWVLHSELTNYFYPRAKLICKVRRGGRILKKYDTAATPSRRAGRHECLTAQQKAMLAEAYSAINPAAAQRQIRVLTSELLTLVDSQARPTTKPAILQARLRVSADASECQTSRAS
ncbi:integrase [Mycobacterium camsae]|uniref:integrase n=1 Tax=Mycobacterium gordonae TaxID=1778 RepID=UPI001F121EA7|nr:integrase [Mycobacterium gordonae]